MPAQSEHRANAVSINIQIRFQEFKIPPVQDALVIGREASIGIEAMRRSLTLLQLAPFDHVAMQGDHEDDIVGAILVRRTVLNKIPRDKLIRLIIDRIKPFMTAEEIMHLHIDAEISLEHQI